MRLVVRLYPRSVRERYGEEIADLLESSPTPRRDLLNVFCHALFDRTEYAMTLSWRRGPRFLAYAALWLFGAYLFFRFTDYAGQMIIKTVLADIVPQPILRHDVFWMRLLTAVCVLVAAVLAFAVARRYWRGSPGTAIAALALAYLFWSVLHVDTYYLTSFHFFVHWNSLGLSLIDQLLWAGFAIVFVMAIQRSPVPRLTAAAGILIVAYAHTAVMTGVADALYSLTGNPFTAYWESIMGGVYTVLAPDGSTAVQVQLSGWWPTIATAIVAGSALASSRREATALDPELVS